MAKNFLIITVAVLFHIGYDHPACAGGCVDEVAPAQVNARMVAGDFIRGIQIEAEQVAALQFGIANGFVTGVAALGLRVCGHGKARARIAVMDQPCAVKALAGAVPGGFAQLALRQIERVFQPLRSAHAGAVFCRRGCKPRGQGRGRRSGGSGRFACGQLRGGNIAGHGAGGVLHPAVITVHTNNVNRGALLQNAHFAAAHAAVDLCLAAGVGRDAPGQV